MGMSWRAFFVSLSQGASELTVISAREEKTSQIHKRRARFGEPTTRGERQSRARSLISEIWEPGTRLLTLRWRCASLCFWPSKIIRVNKISAYFSLTVNVPFEPQQRELLQLADQTVIHLQCEHCYTNNRPKKQNGHSLGWKAKP